MNATPLTVVAHIRARPGEESALREILLPLLDPTRREEGCLNYDLHQSDDDPGRFLFHENWRAKADLDRHLQSAHVKAALAKVGDLLAEPPQITLWNRIG